MQFVHGSRAQRVHIASGAAADGVFGVEESLVRDSERQPDGTTTPDGRALDGTWSRVVFDIVLAPAGV